MIPAALYVRVSTTDKGQDTENQLAQLRQYAAAMGWEISQTYVDNVSASGCVERIEFDKMMIDATRAQFKVLLVWALDRFTREGVAETFIYIKKLMDNKIQFVSYTEEHFRTTGPAGELMIAIAAWIAQQERKRISERTKAGLERVRAKGVKLGPPRVKIDKLRFEAMVMEKVSVRKIAEVMGLARSTTADAMKAFREGREYGA